MKHLLVKLFLPIIFVAGFPLTSNAQGKDEITEISLEVAAKFDFENRSKTPIFKIVLRNDGTALYNGKKNVKLQGQYKGTISREEFDQLAEFLKSRNFSKLRNIKQGLESQNRLSELDPQNPERKDAESIITSAVQGSKRKTMERAINIKIKDNDPSGKAILKIEKAITTTATKINWEKVN